jgi:hypothetical protein
VYWVIGVNLCWDAPAWATSRLERGGRFHQSGADAHAATMPRKSAASTVVQR